MEKKPQQQLFDISQVQIIDLSSEEENESEEMGGNQQDSEEAKQTQNNIKSSGVSLSNKTGSTRTDDKSMDKLH